MDDVEAVLARRGDEQGQHRAHKRPKRQPPGVLVNLKHARAAVEPGAQERVDEHEDEPDEEEPGHGREGRDHRRDHRHRLGGGFEHPDGPHHPQDPQRADEAEVNGAARHVNYRRYHHEAVEPVPPHGPVPAEAVSQVLNHKLGDEDAVEAVLHDDVGIREIVALGVVPRHHDDGIERDDHEDDVVEFFALGDLVHRRHVQPHELPHARQRFAGPPRLTHRVDGVAIPFVQRVAASRDPPLLPLLLHLIHHLLLRAARLQRRHHHRRQQLHHEKSTNANHQRVPQQHGPADGVHQHVRRLVPAVDRQALQHEQRGPQHVIELDVPVTGHLAVLRVVAAGVSGDGAVVEGDAADDVVAAVGESLVPRG